jgi:hypothetical protein
VQDYRRRLNRAERRKAEKAGDGSGAALREAAEEAEFERAKVRPFAIAVLCSTTFEHCQQQRLCDIRTTLEQSGAWFRFVFVHKPAASPHGCQLSWLLCAAGAADAEAQEHEQVGEAGAAAGHQRHGRDHQGGDAGAAAAGDGAAAEGGCLLPCAACQAVLKTSDVDAVAWQVEVQGRVCRCTGETRIETHALQLRNAGCLAKPFVLALPQVQQAQSSESDSEGSTSASDEEGDQEPGSGRDGDGAAAAANAGGAGAARAAKHRAAYGKSRAAALEVLQGAVRMLLSGGICVTLLATTQFCASMYP